MCKLETYTGKLLAIQIKFKTMSNHISESRTGISSCKSPRNIK